MIVKQIVAQGDPQATSIAVAIEQALQGLDLDRLDVAVAYATIPGVEALRQAVGGWPDATRWVVGLDDAITQPSAIDLLAKLPNTEVRLASLASEGRRFHPKLYCLWSSADPQLCVAVIGSANMTLHGLNRNGEVGVILVAENGDEAETLKNVWSQMNSLGKDLPEWDLDNYRAQHDRARRTRQRLVKIGAIPPDVEADETTDKVPAFDGNPVTATLAWTEGASPSAGGRDLEFPRDMMPFFRLSSTPSEKRFRMAPDRIFPLTFTMRTDNQMWRLLFSRDSIFAGIARESLRPVAGNSNRSDLAIVFRRAAGGADYDVDFLQIGSPEYDALVAKSRALGVVSRTRNPGGRHFGYY